MVRGRRPMPPLVLSDDELGDPRQRRSAALARIASRWLDQDAVVWPQTPEDLIRADREPPTAKGPRPTCSLTHDPSGQPRVRRHNCSRACGKIDSGCRQTHLFETIRVGHQG